MRRDALVRSLLDSDEPSVRRKVRVEVLGEDPSSRVNRRLREEIRTSPRVRALLDGAATQSYRKWQGRHWVLQSLAELGYPSGDESLEPLAASVLKTLLHPRYFREYDPTREPRQDAVELVDGRYRAHGSVHGGALLALSRLGVGSEGTPRLAERLLHWQWPDGGWNCRLKPDTSTSSVYETLLSMRGLAAYGTARAKKAADAAAEVFLSRRVVFRRSTGRMTRKAWGRLHYPVYWHHDVLAGLKGLHEVGRLDDPRCGDALDLLEGKRLADGGWAAEETYSHGVDPRRPHYDLVDWGEPDPQAVNPWVTVDALAVLTAAGRT